MRGKIEENFIDLGERSLRNIVRPVRTYRVALGEQTKTSTSFAPENSGVVLALPDKPSIAVLAFQNMSGDPDQEYFADGMADDIITGLSRINWLFVIARNSSFVYKGRARDVRQVGRELGVRYVLEGGVRKSGQRVRINAQLLEAETGVHLWADKFDGILANVFELQDQITDSVVGVVEPRLRKSEVERSRRKRPENIEAYDLYLRGLHHFRSYTPQRIEIAAGLFDHALRLKLDYADAHALLAWCHHWRFRERGFGEADRIIALQHARAAISTGAANANALAASAPLLIWLAREFETATSIIERAISLNASSANAHFHGALVYAFAGRPAPAIAYANRALRLSPFDPFAHTAYEALALAAIEEARHDEAASYFAKAVQSNPGINLYLFAQAVALTLAGRTVEAKEVARRGVEANPSFAVSAIFKLGLAPTLAEKFAEGARQLALPE